MDLKSATKIRIHFRKTILLSSANYELKAQEKYKNLQPVANKLIQKMHINLKNYLFYNNLSFLKYREAIEIYNNDFIDKKNEINDVTRIILLFFPHLLKSTNLHKQIQMYEYFNFNNFIFEDKSQKELESTIKEFFFHYKRMSEINGFMFHRREMIIYLESFLLQYTSKEINEMKEEEIQDMFLLHYFRPFLVPEDYFKKIHKENEGA
jgi:hypothetical protein